MKRAFIVPDLKAPRHKVKRMTNLNTAFHERFIEKFPKHDTISIPSLKEIVTKFNENVWDHVVKNRDGAELPEGLGYLFVGTCPTPISENMDKHLSNKYGQRIEHRNFESDSFIAKIFYTNYANKYKFKMRELWGFKGCRSFTRSVAKEYPSNFKRYVQVDNFTQISRVYTKFTNRDIAIKIAVKPTKEYNEFQID